MFNLVGKLVLLRLTLWSKHSLLIMRAGESKSEGENIFERTMRACGTTNAKHAWYTQHTIRPFELFDDAHPLFSEHASLYAFSIHALAV